MSTPLVAGAIANYLGFEPSATPTMVAEYVTQKSTKNVISGLGNGTPNRLLYVPPDDNPITITTRSIVMRSETSTITFRAGQSGSVRFLANGKTIRDCSNVSTVDEVATCTWKPTRHGANTIQTTITPSSTTISSTTQTSSSVSVIRRSQR
jgi:hypothetical protein